MRPPAVFHSTSHPYRFFGRAAELALLDDALSGGPVSLVAFVGPGGQGKTAIVQHWLERAQLARLDGLFFWSFYRGKDSDLCLRELYAYAEGLEVSPQVSASFCVDRLLPRLRRERWALVLDGTEVVQHELGGWRGRFLHPELGRLLEELAAAPLPGVVVLTTRFELPTLERRRHARLLSLSALDLDSACRLLETLGVQGTAQELSEAARACGLHAKAVELLGTLLRRWHGGRAKEHPILETAAPSSPSGAATEEWQVGRVVNAFQQALSAEEKDILALATAFRAPPTEAQLLAYLRSGPVGHLLHQLWGRAYQPFQDRPLSWLQQQVQGLVDLRLLERVSLALAGPDDARMLDAHPLVRRGFEQALGAEGQKHGAASRAGFLRGRPDRRPPQSLEAAREEVELFHAYCDAGLWNEADGAFVALDNPKHRFLAPAFERDLLTRFFPAGDWRQKPLWPGFGRYRSLAIALEMLGQFEEALDAYPPQDAPLRGDALLALGRVEPVLAQIQAPAPWQTLWQAYRVHALALAARDTEAVRQAGTLIPTDIYEWIHVFEGLLRLGRLDLLDAAALQFGPHGEHAWAGLARRRLLADYRRLGLSEPSTAIDAPKPELEREFRDLMEAYDRGGLPWERGLVRLSLARVLQRKDARAEAAAVARVALELAQRHGMAMVAIDATETLAELGEMGESEGARQLRERFGLRARTRP
ncbi:MAG: hypothetical protein U0793_15850 [Gemmataceae bacterium]